MLLGLIVNVCLLLNLKAVLACLKKNLLMMKNLSKILSKYVFNIYCVICQVILL
jgi:hypothetical protein